MYSTEVGSAREAGQQDERNGRENEPFLLPDGTFAHDDLEAAVAIEPHFPPACSSSPSPPTGKHHRQHANGKLSIFLLLFALSAVALTAIVLGFPSAATLPGRVKESDAGHDSRPHGTGYGDDATGAMNHGNSTVSVVRYHETVPTAAQLRNSSEYILSPSWNFHAPPTTREYHWTILDADLNPDGVFRPMILINNQFPGPLVECNEGDTLVIKVDNKATNATSIHFHGLFQNGTNFMDGTVGVTQCPIAPNSTFTYRFDVRRQSGTYWYHAHHSAQASDGLVGPVVVHSNDEQNLQELPYATDRVVMVQDHYHNSTAELLMDYLQPDKENEEPVPDNALINGRGARSCHDFPGYRCDSSNASPSIFDLGAGERHRLRFINVGAFAEFQIQIDEHPFYVTEVDGTDVHPEPFHRLSIMPAQRYSIVMEANVTTRETFWLRARMVTDCFRTSNSRLIPELKAVVRYISSETDVVEAKPTSRKWANVTEVVCRDLNTTNLHPIEHLTPPPADDFVALRANFKIGAWRLSRGFFNDSTWHANVTHPSLHRFLDASTDSQTVAEPFGINRRAFDQHGELVMQTHGIRTVDISINNFDDGAHPFHLHGHKFFVLAQEKSGYPPRAKDFPAYLAARGGVPENPLRRDTVTVEPYAWVIIRVVLDNPGLWALHCHNMWHAEAGMSMQLLVRSDTVKGWKVDPQQRSMCELEGVSTGMRPNDGIWFGSF